MTEDDDLAWHALNYRTAAPQHAEEMWQALSACVDRKLATERERCAKICDGLATFVHPMAQQGLSPMQHMGAQITYGEHAMAMRAAAAIRASR